jgi:acylglycerol lipase
MAQVYETDPLIEHTPSTFRQTRENLRNFEAILKHSQELGLPLLVQCGSDDKVLVQKTPFSQEGLEKMFAMRDKTVKIYQELFHEVYNEPKEQRDVVLNDLVAWLNLHI